MISVAKAISRHVPYAWVVAVCTFFCLLVSAGLRATPGVLIVPLERSLGWDRATLVMNAPQTAPAALEPRFSEWVARREKREPTAYIVGVREFWGLDFIVTPAVLIPRPETEFIVEEALARMSHTGDASPRVADVGTGSGCIAVSLALERPRARVVGVDRSGAALRWARENARALGAGEIGRAHV